jgi:radical SAM protein with 4Fe4S-binding SPASM domain
MRARLEPFGAWVRVDEPPLLVAVDRDLARKLGLDGGALWTSAPPPAPPAPLEAHLAVTARCALPCEGCYLDASPDGASPPTEVLAGRLRELAARGVFTVAFGGGEPLVRDDLGELARVARSLGLSPVLTTSGAGMTAERATELAAFDQVNVSYDGEGEGYREVRGFAGAAMAERAMGLLREAGVRFGVNVVLTRRSFERVEATARRARALGAVEVQLLRFKPSGRGVGAVYEGARLSEEQARGLYPLLARLAEGGPGVRIDCALVPFLSPHLDDASALERFGVFGCEAGRHLRALRVDGTEAPCSFAPPEPVVAPERLLRGAAEPAVEPGRLLRGAGEGEAVRRFREHADDPPAPCSSCPLRRACRGGCRVVAGHAGDPAGPDPECPRVLDARRARGERA